MDIESKIMNRTAGKYLIMLLLSVFMAVLIMPSFSFGLTIFQSADDAIFFAEALPNVAFQNLGFDKVTNISRVNTVSEITDTTNTVSADFTFILDGTPYSGPGTWESIETADSLDITLNYSLSNGDNVLEFQYTSNGDFTNDVKDETVNASLGGTSLSITKHTEETITPTSKTTNITGNVGLNSEHFNASITIIEDIITPETSQFTITCQSTPVNPPGPVTTVLAEYQTVTDQDGATATFSKYDVTIGGELTYELDTIPSAHQVLKIDENSATESLVMNLLHVTDGNKKIKYQVDNTIQLTYLLKLLGDWNRSEWSWNDFYKITFQSAAAGAATFGTAALVGTDGGAPLTVPVAASVAAVSAAAGGAAFYTVGIIWDWIFQGSSPPAKVEVYIFVENDTMTNGQVAGGDFFPSVPALSEWMQVVLVFFFVSTGIVFIFRRWQVQSE